MGIIAGFSSEKNIAAAVGDLKAQFEACDSRMIIFFASSAYDPHELGKAMSETFPDAVVFGCTSAGEIVSGKMLKNSIVAMSLDSEVIDGVRTEVVTGISNEAADLTQTFAAFEQYYGEAPDEMDIDKYVGIILIDPLQGAEERIMDQIGDLSNVLFVGGSVSDFNFEKTHVIANGDAHPDSAVLALLKLRRGFDIIKTQSLCPMDKNLTVTKADMAKREVIEFDGKPAAVAYADALGTSAEEVERLFMRHPLGLMADGDPYVRSPHQVLPGNRVKFACSILEGMELTLLKATDIVGDTQEAVSEKHKSLGEISGIINFHCSLRTRELEAKGQTEAYGRIFSDIPTVGFSTYGEQYVGHMNQTSTMILFL